MDLKKVLSFALEHWLHALGVLLAAVFATPVVWQALKVLWPYLLAGGVIAVVSISSWRA